MLTIFVTNYWQLFTLRLLTGIAVGGAWVGGCLWRCFAALPNGRTLLAVMSRLASPTICPSLFPPSVFCRCTAGGV
jgi:hypothetical protein